MDLYEVIGVNNDADDTAIRAGWKRAAMRAHPDQGGTREAFELVQTALTVLSDKRRRARYDETGEYDAEPDVDNETSEAHKLIADCLQNIIYDAKTPDYAIAHVDLVTRIRAQLVDGRRQLNDHVKANVRLRARAERLLGRFTRQGAPHKLIEAMIRYQISAMDEEDDLAKRKLARIDVAMAELANVQFRVD